MKEDYLWNKTGEDAEIEGLENSLKMFRYQETNPPILPSKNFVLETKTSNSFWAFLTSRFALASFACLGLIAFLAVNIWIQFAEVSQEKVIATEIKVTKEKISPQNQPSILPINESQKIEQKFVNTKITLKTTIVKPFKKSQLVAQNAKTVLKKDQKIDPATVLTKEELYAYNQLMTALAITGSKLKLVQDKAQSIEN